MHTSNKKGAAVPTDILMEILSRLRVKALIRLKSVCKAWLHLISSEDFIKLHLKRSSLTRAIRLRGCDKCPGLHPHHCILQLGSSCDGLVCLFDRRHAMIHIWNPAIRKSAAIPMINMPIPVILKKPVTKFNDDSITCFWFGLHDNEYKVVLGTKSQMHIIRPYNINNYTQKSMQELTEKTTAMKYYYIMRCDRLGTLFNGDIHWPVVDIGIDSLPRRRRIYSLNLGKEKAREIRLPIEARCSDFSLGEVDGCLAALLKPLWRPIFLELWAMKEYGVEESWTKISVFASNSFTPAVSKSFISKTVLDGNPAKYKSPLYASRKIEIYAESLVPPQE